MPNFQHFVDLAVNLSQLSWAKVTAIGHSRFCRTSFDSVDQVELLFTLAGGLEQTFETLEQVFDDGIVDRLGDSSYRATLAVEIYDWDADVGVEKCQRVLPVATNVIRLK